MTRNILLATLFTLGTAIALVVIFLGEKTTRMPEASAAVVGVQLERGARDYEQYCSPCHGIAGQGGVNAGAPSLNDIVQRKTKLDDEKDAASSDFTRANGIKDKYGTIRNYMVATLISGIRGTAMPAWGQQAGGPLRMDQIENIVTYVLSWNGEVPAPAVAYAQTVGQGLQPTPDPGAKPWGAGQIVFNTKGCVGCHAVTDKTKVGPGLGGLFSDTGTAAYGKNLPNGKAVNEADVLEWIQGGTAAFPDKHVNLNPSADNVTLLQNGVMPGFKLTDEEYANLLVYLKSFKDYSGNPDPALVEAPAQGQPTTQGTPQPAASAVPNQPPAGDTAAPVTTPKP